MEDIYLFSFSNVGYLDYARHSLLSLQRVGLLKYFTYFCLDDEIYQRLLDDNLGFKPEKNQNYKEVEGPFVVKHTDYLEWEPTKERYEYGGIGYNVMCDARYKAIDYMFEHHRHSDKGTGFVFVDLDIIHFRNWLPYIKKTLDTQEITFQSKHGVNEPSTGFMVYQGTDKVRKWFSNIGTEFIKLAVKGKTKDDEEFVLNHLNSDRSIVANYFPVTQFMNGIMGITNGYNPDKRGAAFLHFNYYVFNDKIKLYDQLGITNLEETFKEMTKSFKSTQTGCNYISLIIDKSLNYIEYGEGQKIDISVVRKLISIDELRFGDKFDTIYKVEQLQMMCYLAYILMNYSSCEDYSIHIHIRGGFLNSDYCMNYNKIYFKVNEETKEKFKPENFMLYNTTYDKILSILEPPKKS